MKITAIKQQIKNPDRASVFVDGKYSLSLTLGELVEQKLKPGLEIDESRLKTLKKISDDGKLRARALEWVLNRPRSKKEFGGYMFRKKASSELADKLKQEFEARGYLDDTKFANWLVDVRRRAGKSERAIKSELMIKGVASDVITRVTQDDTGELERLKLIITKKSKLSRYKANPDKLKQYLLRQGFSYTDIKDCLG